MRTILLATALLAMTASSAGAASAPMNFEGTVDSTCLITIDSAGTLGVSGDFTELGTAHAGGSAGTATIQTTDASFEVTATAPVAFASAPAGGEASVTFSSLYSASGATTLTDVSGATPSSLSEGITNLSVGLTATKGSGTFPAGNYSAEIVVTCE